MIARRQRFLGLPLDPAGADDVVMALLHAAEAPPPRPRLVAYLNAHVTNLAARDRSLAQVLRRADLVYADGMSVVLAARLLGIPIRGRATAADYFIRFCWGCAGRGIPVAFIGGPAGLAEACAERMRAEVPALAVVLTHHGYVTERDADALATRIRDSGARIVLLGMGSPQQERLALALAERRAAPAVWCVGALFEYFAGVRPLAPRWMGRLGLEWLFRLVQEPRRLAGRYLIGNITFAARSLRAILKRRLSPSRP